jgi:mannosidase alpha-like ER degradation enhancer 2
MPYVHVNLRTGQTRTRVNNPAEIGTLMLEFGTLSKLTGEPVYYEKAKQGMLEVYRRRSQIGLVGTTIDVETGQWRDRTSHIGGRIDSWYEYLLKAWLLFEDEDFHRLWTESIAAVNRWVADERPDGLWYGRVDMDDGSRVATRFGALEAFFPAVLALGGDLERAARLQRSCYRMWTRWGIEPESMDYVTGQIRGAGYPLRPENLESAYYLWVLTGQQTYRQMGHTMFDAIVARCRTESGYAHLSDVRTGEQSDAMQSFFLAETLKYAYLLFAPPETLDFHSVIFNTEAHPLRRPR